MDMQEKIRAAAAEQSKRRDEATRRYAWLLENCGDNPKLFDEFMKLCDELQKSPQQAVEDRILIDKAAALEKSIYEALRTEKLMSLAQAATAKYDAETKEIIRQRKSGHAILLTEESALGQIGVTAHHARHDLDSLKLAHPLLMGDRPDVSIKSEDVLTELRKPPVAEAAKPAANPVHFG